jgi:indoleacetamide hydrolase
MLENAHKADKSYKTGTNRMLEGVPIGIKDNVDTKCSPTTGGTPALTGNQSKFNCTLWERLSTFGGISAGKTNLHELSFGTTSVNGLYGPARCAFDKSRSAGGSSGGSGGAVGLGTVPVALGTDTGGSIRVPATCNGVVGYKPTINRWPADYGVKMSHWRDTIGCLAVSMDDVMLLDEVVTD